jgi:endoglucanase
MKFLLPVFAFLLVVAKSGQADVPADRLATLAKGVNIITVFTPTPLVRIYADLDQIKLAGLRHIRIFIDPGRILQDGSSGTTRLDQVVQTAISDGLGVILCMASSQYPPDEKATSVMVSLWDEAWEHLASRYSVLSPAKLFFELANEPTMEPARWNALQEEFAKRIRRYAPKLTILMTGSPLSTVWGLGDLSPIDDDNVVYTFHLYQPMPFTHQGAEWDDRYTAVRGLVYPPNQANVASVEQHVPPSEDNDLSRYLASGAGALQNELSVAEKWAESRHVHLVVTEFGVYRKAPPSSRAAWLSEARQGIEAAGFGWTVWEYDGGFGIAPDLIGCTAVMRALGLQSPGHRARCRRP